MIKTLICIVTAVIIIFALTGKSQKTGPQLLKCVGSIHTQIVNKMDGTYNYNYNLNGTYNLENDDTKTFEIIIGQDETGEKQLMYTEIKNGDIQFQLFTINKTGFLYYPNYDTYYYSVISDECQKKRNKNAKI